MGLPLYPGRNWARDIDENGSDEPWREEWRRDYARVIHSPSFRRLQGKTQLFPGHESDFFRNRLTHSLEVAQIAESIAYRINGTHEYFKDNQIEPRVCMTAGLLHDLGHPPFGHNGEHALDDKMKRFGGFEGNAQTLRIIAKVEKKRLRETGNGQDARAGLNLAYRTLGSILKYDKRIPNDRGKGASLVKGYYADDSDVVRSIKEAVAPGWIKRGKPFKTIECAIMDIADDIGYSTYDLEDSFKAGFLSPIEILASPPDLLKKVAKKVGKQIRDPGFSETDVIDVFLELFADLGVQAGEPSSSREESVFQAVKAFERSRDIAGDGRLRTAFSSDLVGKFIGGIEVELDEKFPMLSTIKVEPSVLRAIETLKTYTFEATIFSTRLKVAEFRGYEVVSNIFDALSDEKGYLLMPDDVRSLYSEFEGNATARMRVISDFVAGMTDRYALEFHARLHSDTAQSMFKPV